MAHVVNSVIECPFPLEGVYTIEVDGVNVDINPSGDLTWYRIAFCNGSNTGGETDPLSFSSHLDTVLGADYSVPPPTALGKVSIKRRTGAGAGTIDFTVTSEATIIQCLLGFTTSVLNFADGQTITAEYPPAYRLLLIGRGNDTDWQAEPGGTVATEQDDGAVYALDSELVKQRRSFTLEHHARDVTVWTTVVGIVGEFPNTPVYPAPASGTRMTTQTEALPTAAPSVPFTMLDFFTAAKGRRLAGMWSIFQQVIVGATTPLWDECYLDKQTCERGPFVKLRDVRWNSIMSPGPWGFVMAPSGSGVSF